MDFADMKLIAADSDDEVKDLIDNNFLRFRENYGDTIVLVIADLGLWYGREEGGKHGNLSFLLSSIYEDYNSIYYNPKDGTFVIEAIHHDGTNYFTIYKLTDKGINYLKEKGDSRETHQHIINTEGMTTQFEIE